MAFMRYAESVVGGVLTTLIIGFLLMAVIPWMRFADGWILVVPICAGTVGGLVSAKLAPSKKMLVTTLVGLALAGVLISVFSLSVPRLGRNPLTWYWPAYVLPAFALGGAIATWAPWRPGSNRVSV
jgi:hypothetical protein